MNRMVLSISVLLGILTSCGGMVSNTYKAGLAGANERPTPVVSTGVGSVTATLDTTTRVLTVTGTYEKLSGAVTAPGALMSGGHIHGPSTTETNAGVLFDVVVKAGTTGSGTISGTATLTAAQIADIDAGKYYVNLHTVNYPNGEIRGQLVRQ
jgi:CHRD domain